jgi:hypothetical protein
MMDANDEAEKLLRRAEVLFRQLCRLTAADDQERPSMEAATLQEVKDLRAQCDYLARELTLASVRKGAAE